MPIVATTKTKKTLLLSQTQKYSVNIFVPLECINSHISRAVNETFCELPTRFRSMYLQ